MTYIESLNTMLNTHYLQAALARTFPEISAEQHAEHTDRSYRVDMILASRGV